MSLVPSLLHAIVKADGEAMVMHAGDKPYVVSPTGQVELASRGLTLDAVNGIVGQLLPREIQNALEEFGAIQYELPAAAALPGEHFTVVAARGGDDLWVEIRRRRVIDDDHVPEELFTHASPRKAPPPPPVPSPAPPVAAAPAVAAAPPARLEPAAPPQKPVAPPSEPAVAPPPPPAIVLPVPRQPVEAEVELGDAIGTISQADAETQPADEVSIDLSLDEPIEPDDDLALPDATQLWPAPPPHSSAVPSAHASTAHQLHASDEDFTPSDLQVAVAIPVPLSAPPAPAIVAELPTPLVLEPPPERVVSEVPPPTSPAVEAEPEPPVVYTAPPPPIVVEASPTPVVQETPPPLVVLETPPPIVQETPTPPIVVEAATQPIEEETSTPLTVQETPTPPIVMETATPPIVEETSTPLVVQTSPTSIIQETSTPPVVEETPPPPVAEETPTLPVIQETPKPVVVHEASRPPVEHVPPAPPVAEAQVAPAASIESDEPPHPAVVLPIARSPIRAEAPPPLVDDPTLSGLERLLRVSAARGASTLYLSSESRPSVRVDGELQVLDGEPVHTPRDVESLLLTLMPERSHEALRTGALTEWIRDIEGVGRVRCMSFRDHRGPGGVFRLMPTRSVSVEQLGLPRHMQSLAIEPEGLLLVAGPRSSGKRTLMSAFVDLMNRTRRDHIITIEREINIVHERGSSFISQREVRGTDDDFVAAARGALREDPDVLVIEDLRTGPLMNVALEAAASGHLVVGGFSAHTAAGAIDRIIDLYAPEYRQQVQFALADSLRGVIVQVLLRKIGGGRLPARELLLNTPAVSGLIAEGKTSQLPMAIEGGRRYGMMPMNDALVGLVQSGAVEARDAYRQSTDRPALLAALTRQGIDTSFVERLA